MKQYLDASLPMEIVEAARIDGAGEFYTFNKIVLPIMKPALAVQAIFAFVSSWNNYFIPAQGPKRIQGTARGRCFRFPHESLNEHSPYRMANDSCSTSPISL